MKASPIDQERIQEFLGHYLREKLDAVPAQSGGGLASGQEAGEDQTLDQVQVNRALDRYQHRIWQLKDRLSCEVYGPHTEGLVDTFLMRYGLSVPKHSKEYLWILRKVLQNEIRFYTLLMQRISGNHGGPSGGGASSQDLLGSRKIPRIFDMGE